MKIKAERNLKLLLSEMDAKAKKQKLQEEFQLPMTVKIDQ